jgi:hypothetical protein
MFFILIGLFKQITIITLALIYRNHLLKTAKSLECQTVYNLFLFYLLTFSFVYFLVLPSIQSNLFYVKVHYAISNEHLDDIS